VEFETRSSGSNATPPCESLTFSFSLGQKNKSRESQGCDYIRNLQGVPDLGIPIPWAAGLRAKESR
jgi:hypothetical protein